MKRRAVLLAALVAALPTVAGADHRPARPRGPALARIEPVASSLQAELDRLQDQLAGPRRDVRPPDLDCLAEYLESVRDEVRALNDSLSRREPHRTRRALGAFCADEGVGGDRGEYGVGGGTGRGEGGGGGGGGEGREGRAREESPAPGSVQTDAVDVRVRAARRVNSSTVFVELSVRNKAEHRMLSLSRAVLVDASNGTVYTQTHVSDAPNDVGLSMVGAGETVTGTIAFRVTKGRNELSLRLQDADGDPVSVPLAVER